MLRVVAVPLANTRQIVLSCTPMFQAPVAAAGGSSIKDRVVAQIQTQWSAIERAEPGWCYFILFLFSLVEF